MFFSPIDIGSTDKVDQADDQVIEFQEAVRDRNADSKFDTKLTGIFVHPME